VRKYNNKRSKSSNSPVNENWIGIIKYSTKKEPKKSK
jgi:hypothetical protein